MKLQKLVVFTNLGNTSSPDILRISPKRVTCDIVFDISYIATFLCLQKLLISWSYPHKIRAEIAGFFGNIAGFKE